MFYLAVASQAAMAMRCQSLISAYDDRRWLASPHTISNLPMDCVRSAHSYSWI